MDETTNIHNSNCLQYHFTFILLSVMYCNLDENLNVKPTGRYEAGQEVTVTCLKSHRHVLLSEKEITCQDNGKWSSEPDCRVCGKNMIQLTRLSFQ